MINNGMTDLEVKTLNANQLKEEMKKRGQFVSGTKAELQPYLLEAS